MGWCGQALCRSLQSRNSVDCCGLASSWSAKRLATCNVCKRRWKKPISSLNHRSGRAIIQALIDGETDPAKLAALAHWKVRASAATLRAALHGRIKRHHRFLLRLHLQQVDALDAAIADITREADAG